GASMIRFLCSGCGCPHSSSDAFAGLQAKCIRCGAPLRVPGEPVAPARPRPGDGNPSARRPKSGGRPPIVPFALDDAPEDEPEEDLESAATKPEKPARRRRKQAEDAPDDEPESPDSDGADSPTAPASKKRRVALIAGGAVAVAVLGLVGYLALAGSGSKEPPPVTAQATPPPAPPPAPPP